MSNNTNSGKKYSLIRSLALTLAGFLLLLFGLNLYQYFRVKSDVASTLLHSINEKELGELRSFMNNIGEKLNIVRDWGKNGVLDSEDIASLNKKLFPLLDHQERVSGVLLADSGGREYFLTRKDGAWLTRVTKPGSGGNRAVYKSWLSPEQGRDLREIQTDYDPRKRPWFHRSSHRNEVYWTSLYTFFENREKGITASVSWDADESPQTFFVFGIDISFKGLQKLLSLKKDETSGIMFLVNSNGSTIVPGPTSAHDQEPVHDEKLLLTLVDQWKTSGQPSREIIRYTYQNRSWLGSLQPLIQHNTVFWIGVTAPEKELLSRLNKTLLRVDLTDILVATGGGMILLFFIWKNGGFRPGHEAVDPVVRLHRLINEGEGAEVEFKSTIRTNLKTGKKGKEIELAWLKAVVAFLNSDGGALLLGVDDNGRICGLEKDAFENKDRCLLHVKNLVNQHIGAEFSGFLNITLLAHEDRDVVMIEIQSAGQPVFLKIGKNEEFYIRSGPSSVKLSPSQMISYVLQNRLVEKHR